MRSLGNLCFWGERRENLIAWGHCITENARNTGFSLSKMAALGLRRNYGLFEGMVM